MSAVVEVLMARRPRKDASEKGTTHVRLMTDLAEMISWIVRLENLERRGGSAVLLDPMLRSQVRARYKRYEPEIEKIKAKEEELRKAEEAAQASILKKTPRQAEG
jgi:hypothetical protein